MSCNTNLRRAPRAQAGGVFDSYCNSLPLASLACAASLSCPAFPISSHDAAPISYRHEHRNMLSDVQLVLERRREVEALQLAVARQVVVRQEREVRVLRARDDVGRRVELRGLHRGARERRVQRHGVVGSCGGEIQAGGVSVFLHARGVIVFFRFLLCYQDSLAAAKLIRLGGALAPASIDPRTTCFAVWKRPWTRALLACHASVQSRVAFTATRKTRACSIVRV